MRNVTDGFLRHALSQSLEAMLLALADGSRAIEVGRCFGRVECILLLMKTELPNPATLSTRGYWPVDFFK